MKKSFQDYIGKVVEPLPCEVCGKPTEAWALYEDAEGSAQGWRCGSCIVDVERVQEEFLLSWADVRAKRDQMLQALDWTQLPDVPDSVSEAARETRQKLRDVTDCETPAEAWEALSSLAS